MITSGEIRDFLLGKFGLKYHQEIIGKDLWNHLIHNQCYQKMKSFVTIELPKELENWLISDDELTNDFFGAKLRKLTTRNQKKFFKKYRITGSKVVSLVNMNGEYELINIYGNYWDEEKSKWSKVEWILFSYELSTGQ